MTHDVTGLAELGRVLVRFGDRVPIAIKRSDGLLVEHLQARGHVLFPVSPPIAACARERYKVASVKATPSRESPVRLAPPTGPPELPAAAGGAWGPSVPEVPLDVVGPGASTGTTTGMSEPHWV